METNKKQQERNYLLAWTIISLTIYLLMAMFISDGKKLDTEDKVAFCAIGLFFVGISTLIGRCTQLP